MLDDEINSLKLAYDHIPLSYQWILSRVASAENRVDTLMTQAAAVLVAAVIAVTALNDGAIPVSWSLVSGIVSLALFGAIIVMGVKTRQLVRLRTTDASSFVWEWPGHEPTSWVGYTPSDFMTRRLKALGEHQRFNKDVLGRVGRRSDVIGWLLIAELLSALLWGALSPFV